MLPLIGIVTTGVQVAGAITSGGKDGERLAANKAAFAAALAGDDNALLFLKQRTGEYGIVFVPGYGQIGGWAGSVGPADAKVKYNAALAARRGQTALQSPGVTAAIDQAATAAGVSIWPWTRNQILTAAALGGGALLLYMVVRRRRGRRA